MLLSSRSGGPRRVSRYRMDLSSGRLDCAYATGEEKPINPGTYAVQSKKTTCFAEQKQVLGV